MLLGRRAEKSQLSRLLTQAARGNSGALLVLGEAGIGKTTLLQHAERRAAGWTVLRARGTQYDAELPFAGLSELLLPVTEKIESIPERQAEALAGALAIGPPQPADHFAIYAAVLSLLAAVAEEKPVLVALDDVHWLDRSTQAALAFVLRRMRAERIAAILAQRSDSSSVLDAVPLQRLVLSGVPTDAAREIVARNSEEPLAPAVADQILATARGNPLALRELPRLLSPAQLSGAEPPPDPLPVSTDLQQMYASRIDGLPSATRRALLVAAANGSGRLVEIAGALEELGLDVAVLEPAEKAGIISVDTEVAFSHPLVRASVYHAAGPADRRGAHRALAAGFRGSSSQARRAWHLAASTIGQDESVALAMEAAAQEAGQRGAHSVSAQMLERAAQLTPEPEPLLRRQLAAAVGFHFAGQPDRALALLDRARLENHDAVPVAEIDHLRGRVLMDRGPLAEAQAVLADGARAIEADHPAKAAAMLGDSALACLMSGQAGLAEALIRRAFELRHERYDGPGEVVHILHTGVLVMVGRAREAEQHIDVERERIAQHRAAGDFQMLVLSAIWLMWAEELALVSDMLTDAIDDARRRSMPGLLPLALAQRAELRWRSGDWTQALADAGEAVRLAQETGQNVALGFALAGLALIQAGLGREAECRSAAEAAVDIAETVGSHATMGRIEAALGLLELGLGDASTAARHLRQADAYVRAHGVGEPTVLPYAGDLLEALVRAGRIDEAQDVMELLEERVAATNRTWTRAILARGRGLVAAEGEYEDHFLECLRIHEGMPGTFETARANLAYGERLRRSGLRLKAREPLRRAREGFERLGAEPWVSRARSELRAAGEAGTRARRALLHDLTPQELQVAFAVAAGSTNREVAASLFLSPKTIEYHLSNVYSKLDLRSRTELVRLLASQGGAASRLS